MGLSLHPADSEDLHTATWREAQPGQTPGQVEPDDAPAHDIDAHEGAPMTENLATALAAFQSELPSVGKDSKATVPGKDGKAGYSYRYADLASVSAIVLPLLGKHGLSFSSMPTLDDSGRFVLMYSLRHVSGDAMAGAYPLAPANSTPQQVGSSITYARRYALCAVTGVCPDEDDDGASAPNASSRPVERHESTWDPAEQEMLREQYEAELHGSKTNDELQDVARRIGAAKRSGELSPATSDRLLKAWAAKRAELNGAPTTTGGLPDNTDPA